MVRKEKDDFLAVHELAAANCLIRVESAMEIFEITKKFPKEETYSLTDQIRRASRSGCSNLSEAIFRRPSSVGFPFCRPLS